MILNYLQLVLGIILISSAIYDFCVTAFVPTNEGKITKKVSKLAYHFFFLLARKNGVNKILNYLGLVIIVSVCIIWVLLAWAGLALVFLSDPYSIINSTTQVPADVWEKIYYTGFTISTLGTGDYIASTNGWRIVTALAGMVGLILITMSITYLVPVISNAIQKRALSLYIAALGESPEQIVINSFDGSDFKSISSQFTALADMVFRYAQNHLAYPILHYMHNANQDENIILQIASLDEALTIFLFHIPEDKRPSPIQLQLIRRSITAYLQTIGDDQKAKENPPVPNLERIHQQTGVGLAHTDPPAMERLYNSLSNRRRLLYENLLSDGWQWDQLQGEKFKTDLDIMPENL